VENSQVRMISCACGRRSIGKTRRKRSSSSCQPPTICGVSDDGGPGVHDVGVGREAAGDASLGLVEAGRTLRGRVNRQC
jgi:hypothetical protein